MCPVSLKCGDSPPCSGCLVGLKRSPSNTRVVVKLMTSSSTLPSTPLTSCPPMIGLVTRRKPNCKRNQQLPPTPRAWCFNVTLYNESTAREYVMNKIFFYITMLQENGVVRKRTAFSKKLNSNRLKLNYSIQKLN
uniref:Uncharacterized protein n=1 Tax=Cacopsylla melanoneura TaxID=428564 RepID=A0A8D8LG85_9HEMI